MAGARSAIQTNSPATLFPIASQIAQLTGCRRLATLRDRATDRRNCHANAATGLLPVCFGCCLSFGGCSPPHASQINVRDKQQITRVINLNSTPPQFRSKPS